MHNVEFEKLAEPYSKMGADDLEEEFSKQLSLVDSGAGSATRGSSFWEEMKGNVVAGLLRNRDLGSATLGMITAEVLAKLTAAGIDLQEYRLVIAVFIGIVARAVWDALEARSKKPSGQP